MGDLVTKLRLDGSDFTRGMNDASKSVDDFKDASKMSASELLNQMKSMDKLGRSTSNYRSQLSQMSRQLQDLTINYQAMSEEMKNSDFGKAVASKIQEITNKAAEMRDTLGDVQASVKLLSSDTVNLDAFKMGVEGISSAFSLVASTGLMSADSTEKFMKVLARLKAIEASTNAVIKISNILNKDSILMLKLKQIQTNLATKAQTKYTASTISATAAQRIFNAVAKANPYVLLATAIIGVTAALFAFERRADDASDSQKELNNELKKGTDYAAKYRSTYSDTFGSLITTFTKLQKGWSQLKTDLEKTDFIKNNTEEFRKLGVEVTGVKEAEDILVNNSELFIKTLTLRAKAAANASIAMDAYKEALNIDMKGFDKLPKAGDLVPKDVQNPRRYGLAWDHMEADGMHNDYRFTEAGANQYIIENQLATKYIQKEKLIKKANDALQDQLDLEKELNTIMSQFNLGGNNGGNGGNGNPTQDAEVGSAAYYNQLIDERNKKLQNEVHTQEEILAIQQEIARLEALRDKALGKPTDSALMNIKPVTLQDVINRDMQNAIIEIPAIAKIEGVEFEDVTFSDLNAGISDAISGMKSLNNVVSSVGKAVEDLGEGWDDNKSIIENITTKIGDMLTIMQSITTVIETINALTKIFDSLQLVGWQLGKKKESQTIAEAGAEAALVGLKSQEAVAGTVAAGAEGAQSASKIPYVGWILAIGAIAAIVAALVAAKSSMNFATGGIVPGMSFGGDKIAAQLNSGEMVLNTQQQRNLFDIINNGNGIDGGGHVEFVIKGQDLKGVLTNYDKKMSRI